MQGEEVLGCQALVQGVFSFSFVVHYHRSDLDARLILWKSHNPDSMRVDMDVVLVLRPPIPASTVYHHIYLAWFLFMRRLIQSKD